MQIVQVDGPQIEGSFTSYEIDVVIERFSKEDDPNSSRSFLQECLNATLFPWKINSTFAQQSVGTSSRRGPIHTGYGHKITYRAGMLYSPQ